MKALAAVVVVLMLFVAVALHRSGPLDRSAGTAPAVVGAPVGAALLLRGEYLARAADCVACHTVPESGRPFAGGVAFELPVGTIYSTNITADEAYGIGGWSDDEFVRAVRDGIGKDGQQLYPAFPYTAYTQLSRDDVLAIKAYLLTLPAVQQPNHNNDLAFPFNQRWAVTIWNAAFFDSRRFKADAAKSAEWNSGAYLVTVLGHCGECHTPRNIAFGLDHRKELTGAELQGWRAYNITPHPKYGIGNWSDADLAHYLTTGFAEKHAIAGGPMGEAVTHSLQYLAAGDVAAIVTYLRSIPAQEGIQRIDVDSQPPAALADGHALGLQLFQGACASCHEWNGQGLESPYAALLGTRGVNDPEGTNVTQAILRGANLGVGETRVFMPAFGSGYSDTEVAALANYVIGQFGGKRGRVTPHDVAKRRRF